MKISLNIMRISQIGKGFIAQGSENGFGKKYARGINDNALTPEDKFIQIVSCNTHNISCLTKTIAFNEDSNNNLDKGDFICIRRANDLSQERAYSSSKSWHSRG